MLTLRSSSASRVCACGSWTGRSETDISGAVTSRMITSTRATSMIGVTLTREMMVGDSTARRRTLPPHHGDLCGPERTGFVDHAHELPVRDLIVAAHDHLFRSARGQRTLHLRPERFARD